MTATVLDEALQMLAPCGYEFDGGLSNHGPMAAEALVVLGRDEAVVPWVGRYRQRLGRAPWRGAPLDTADWNDALGNYRLVPAWEGLFLRELSRRPWRAVLSTWVPRLLPGLFAAATHGVIRTAHAARSLEAGESPQRLDELARGLAYWAATFHQLPGRPASGRFSAADALSRVPHLPAEKVADGLISTGVRALEDMPEFLPVPGWLDTTGDVGRTLSALTQAMARVYLADGGKRPIVFIHSVTGPSALRLLVPYIDDATARQGLGFAWQVCAALYATFQGSLDAPAPSEGRDLEDLIDMALASGDEHAIKFTEACLRENAIAPDPVFAAAAADASMRLRA